MIYVKRQWILYFFFFDFLAFLCWHLKCWKKTTVKYWNTHSDTGIDIVKNLKTNIYRTAEFLLVSFRAKPYHRFTWHTTRMFLCFGENHVNLLQWWFYALNFEHFQHKTTNRDPSTTNCVSMIGRDWNSINARSWAQKNNLFLSFSCANGNSSKSFWAISNGASAHFTHHRLRLCRVNFYWKSFGQCVTHSTNNRNIAACGQASSSCLVWLTAVRTRPTVNCF